MKKIKTLEFTKNNIFCGLLHNQKKNIFLKKLVLQKKVIEEILIKNEPLHVKCLYKENY